MSKRKDDEPQVQGQKDSEFRMEMSREQLRVFIAQQLKEADTSLDDVAHAFAEEALQRKEAYLEGIVGPDVSEMAVVQLGAIAREPVGGNPLHPASRRNVTARFVETVFTRPYFDGATEAAKDIKTWSNFAIWDDFALGADLVTSRIFTGEEFQINQALRQLIWRPKEPSIVLPGNQSVPLNQEAEWSLAQDRQASVAAELLTQDGFALVDDSLRQITAPQATGTIYEDFRYGEVVRAGAELAATFYKAVYPLTGQLGIE